MMDKYNKMNLELWNELTPIHARSDFYDVEGFKKGKCTLKSIELTEVGDVSGKPLLHLQCHFGLDTLSWARLGAKVTGVDFSDEAIALARSLSKETGIKADFICSDIHKLPYVLNRKFDIVFTSYGVLVWLPDLKEWAEIIVHFLKRNGIFYIVESHPFSHVFENSEGTTGYRVTQSYFHKSEPIQWEPGNDYADPDAKVAHSSNEWQHSLSDILNALISAGLTIEFLHEFPQCVYKAYPFMEQDKAGWWQVKGNNIPHTFSLKATKTRNQHVPERKKENGKRT